MSSGRCEIHEGRLTGSSQKPYTELELQSSSFLVGQCLVLRNYPWSDAVRSFKGVRYGSRHFIKATILGKPSQ